MSMSYKDKIKEIPFGVPFEKYRDYFQKKRFKHFLTKTEMWTEEQTREWQLERLREIVDYAYVHVPLYKRIYSTVGYRLGDIRTFADFQSLPTVSKSDIKADLQAASTDEVSKMCGHICHTGGSTDKPMQFYLDSAIVARERAFFEYYWEKNGFRFGQKCVVLRGHQAYPELGRYTKKDYASNYLLCDSRFISERHAFLSIDRDIKSYGARIMQAYPSSAYLLAKSYVSHGIIAPHFDYVFLGSENTYENQIATIQEVFSAKNILFHYGHSECAAIAIKYANNMNLGFCPFYGLAEFLDDRGAEINIGELGEIVATGFNHSTPFIRYRTGDYAIKSSYKSSDYMANYTSVDRIEGRKHEFVLTKDERKVSLCAVAGAHIHSLSKIGDMQYAQKEPGKLSIMVTSMDVTAVPSDVLDEIKKDFEVFFKGTMDIEVKPVATLAKTPAGKKIMLFQSLDLNL